MKDVLTGLMYSMLAGFSLQVASLQRALSIAIKNEYTIQGVM